MLLNYDFLEWVDDEPQRNTSLTASIDKALADRKLARQNKPRVRIKGGLSLRATLDAFGEELSRLKSEQNTTIKATRLGGIVNKIKSGLPFGTISAFRVFKPYFEAIFTDDQQALLKKAYSSGLRPNEKDKISKLYLAQMKENKTKFREATDDIDPTKSIKVKEFFIPTGKVIPQYKILVKGIYEALSRKLGKNYVDEFINSNATMRDFMSSEKLVKKYRFTQKDNIKRTQELKSLLDQKRHFLGYLQVTGYWKDKLNDPLLPSKEVSFFVFQNEPSNSFNLKDQLLDLAKYFNQEAICYCQNAETGKVDLVLATEKDFDKVDWTFTGITFSAPNELPQSLTRLQDKVYTFFKKEDKDNYGVYFKDIVKTQIKAIRLPRGFTEGLGVMDFVKSSIIARQNSSRTNGYQQSFSIDEIEDWERKGIFDREKLKCLTSKSFRQSYNHNVKIRKVANAMRQGKKVSRMLLAKVLANTIDTDAGYCFISDLATQLDSISPRLSKSIVTAIEQAEGIRLLYALIDKITYNSLHNTLNFIFDIDNPMSDQSLNELVVEVPREALKNVKLPQIKNVLTSQIYEGAYQFRGNDYQFKG
ncbi:hypothetical protein [Helicobacter pylori]|uniref:Uncharacterized protein n=1 Tax=Helicobacter pylori HP260AFii TaxID=1159077 RepID=A0ABC9S945_HELPX|nr:hypothetical protein [Helicobacter pylori]EMH19690.1 hypothetical protein HMPREF1416_00674 [Helicobacter pylori GAM260ASi]EMH29440.1 hypothetical protein HMPREF1422_00946 [Helicobacter pylori GAM268Bii]EMH62935.1 hypothetical protein HMPREF1448_01002 [Helicobacter pylori HP260AFi]EMH66026.1 hypothetical protein HMPREF1450_01336 [Helicobacter pylori HP260ASii]EMH66257.1 hypothetical protein HMPREF1449_01115 [Helicobacter pylori HP260AFii]